MKPWLFFTDVDGTLLCGREAIPAPVLKAARAFQKAGGLIALCTGRSPRSAKAVAETMRIHIPCILQGGALLYSFKQEAPLHGIPAPPSLPARLPLVLAACPDISVQVHTNTRTHLLHSTAFLQAHGIPEELETQTSTLGDVEGPVWKVTLACEDAQRLHFCRERFFSDARVGFRFASRHFAELSAPEAHKAALLNEVLERFGIPAARTFAAGDALADMVLLNACAHSFAPQNAPRAVLSAADEPVPPAQDGGMRLAFESALRIMQS